MSLEYSDRATVALAELYRKFNKKTIFIEDTNGRLIYERLLNKLLGSGVISRVFPLHGRDAVLADWRKNYGSADYIYVIDGDLDLIRGIDLSDKNLLHLDHYCIENVVISPLSVSDVVIDYLKPGVDMEMVAEHLGILVESIAKKFAPLYVLYAVSRSESTGLADVSEGAMRYFSKNTGFDDGKLYSRILSLSRELRMRIGKDRFRLLRREISARVRRSSEVSRLLSGKLILLPILHKYAEGNLSYVGSQETFLKQASRYAAIDPSSRFGAAVIDAVGV